MKMNEYRKPEMKFVEIRNENSVANTCWGGHGSNMSWYYDTQGEGYVSFQIAGGSCALNLTNVLYYDKQNDDTPEKIDGNDPKYKELYNALIVSGGESGNPFKGEGVDFPINPDPEWS